MSTALAKQKQANGSSFGQAVDHHDTSMHIPVKKVLVVEDDYSLREALEDTLSLANFNVVTAKHAEQAIELLSKEKDILMVVTDINMGELSGHDLLKHITVHHSHIPVLLMTAYGSVRDSVDAIHNGAVDYLVKPFEPKELVDIVHRQLGSAVVNENDMPIAEDEYSKKLLQLGVRVAQSNSTVLILGESGTGKEVLARYIHQQSLRAKQPFIAINCAAIPENMLEAMLFGYEKGAYTGAYASTPGKFEQANGGTLLLDELSEMDIGLQAKLLRVLQEREVERLGGRKTISLDVRVIATSNRDMRQCVADGKFREDLYYRLSVLPLVWKPLRERTDDILPLATMLLKKHAEKQKRKGLSLSDSAQKTLCSYTWPGNVRELDNIMQRALILQAGTVIESDDLGLGFANDDYLNTMINVSENPISNTGEDMSSLFDDSHRSASSIDASPIMSSEEVAQHSLELGINLQKREFEIIAKTLSEEGGSRKNTAERLGISPRTLRYKLAKMRDMGIGT
jgi:two-component system response regulator FlrC